MDKPLDYIFIDTSVFQKEGFFKEVGVVSKFFELAVQGYLCILLPSITEKEWLKHFKDNASVGLKVADVERKLSLIGSNKEAESFLTKYKALIDSFDTEELVETVFKNKVNRKGVQKLDYTYCKESIEGVFERYFNKKKPFGDKGKNKEFPDAFVLVSLECYASQNQIGRVVVFSEDKDMKEYDSGILYHQEPGLFLDDLLKNRLPEADKKDRQEDDINKLIAFIQSQNQVFAGKLSKAVEKYLSDPVIYTNHFCYADIEEVKQLEVSLDITPKDMEIRMVTDDEIEAVIFPEVDAAAMVEHFSDKNSMWDPEDKEWLYKAYEADRVEISSFLTVTVKMDRTELDMGQEPCVEIMDIDFTDLQDSLDGEF